MKWGGGREGGGYISSGKSAKSKQGIEELCLDSGLYINTNVPLSISAKEAIIHLYKVRQFVIY